MQRSVHDYLKALEAGDADKAASLFIPDGWVESPFLGRLPVRGICVPWPTISTTGG
jgi:hypothetical protein